MERYALIVIVLAFAVLAFALARRRRRGSKKSAPISEIIQQHIDLFQGGRLSEPNVRVARITLEWMLDRGEIAKVEANLQPGTEFAVNVRALAEIGYGGWIVIEAEQDPKLADPRVYSRLGLATLKSAATTAGLIPSSTAAE